MSNLETLKAEHPEWCFNCGATVGGKSPCGWDQNPVVAALLALVQHHEAELAKAKATVQQQARELEEADEALFELFQIRDRDYGISDETVAVFQTARSRLEAARHSARAESEAQKEK